MSDIDAEYIELNNNNNNNNNLNDSDLNKTENEETLAIEIDEDLSDTNSINEENSEEQLILPLNENNERVGEAPVARRTSNRIIWADLIRIFASYLVVLTHVCWYYNPGYEFESYDWFIVKGYHGVSRICVPFFIMISGIFFLKPTKTITIKQTYSKYVYRIFKTYLVWSSFYAVVYNYFIFPGGGFKPLTKEILTDMYHVTIFGYGHLWYLGFVMGLYMATPIIKSITVNREIAWYTVILSSIVTQIVPTICDITNILLGSTLLDIYRNFIGARLKIEVVGSFTTYYILGYLLSSGDFKKIHIYLSYILGIIGMFLTLVLKFIHNHIIQNNDERFYDFHMFPVVMATAGGFMFFKYSVSKYVEPLENKEWFTKIVSSFSDCSFGVYLIHMLILKLVYNISRGILHNHTFNPLYWTPIYSLFIYILCFLSIYILRKYSFFRSIS